MRRPGGVSDDREMKYFVLSTIDPRRKPKGKLRAAASSRLCYGKYTLHAV
jgi:hypothetical protein